MILLYKKEKYKISLPRDGSSSMLLPFPGVGS
jgi:hypothetical protein